MPNAFRYMASPRPNTISLLSHGDHAAKYGAQERGRPAEQLSGEAEERLAGDKGVGHMPRQPAEGGNDGGDGRAPHAQRGKAQLSEDQQIVQQGVEAVGGQTEGMGTFVVCTLRYMNVYPLMSAVKK